MPEGDSPAEPASASPTVVPPAPARPSSLPRSGPAPRVVLIIAVAVVVVLAVVFLGASGRGSSGGSSSNAAASTFSSARGVADRFAAEHGLWTLLVGLGVALANASYFAYNGSTGNASCIPITLAGTVPSNLSLPEFHGNLTSGEAPIWLFDYVAPEVGELAVFEVGDQVSLAIELPASCESGLSQLRGITTPIVDSSTAVSAAAAAGGAAFLQAHPTGVSLTMEIFGGVVLSNASTVAPEWLIGWSTCSNTPFSSGAPTSGYQFSTIVNATTGAVLPTSITNSTCGPTLPPSSGGIASAITLGADRGIVGPGTGGTIASQGCNSGDYCFTVPIVFASQNVTPADFELNVTDLTNGSLLGTTAGFAIADVTGAVLVYSTGAVETQWTSAAGTAQTLLAAGMTIYVDIGPATPTIILGLNLTGEGPFAGSGLGITLN